MNGWRWLIHKMEALGKEHGAVMKGGKLFNGAVGRVNWGGFLCLERRLSGVVIRSTMLSQWKKEQRRGGSSVVACGVLLVGRGFADDWPAGFHWRERKKDEGGGCSSSCWCIN